MNGALTPAGRLRWAADDGDPVGDDVRRLESAFAADWRDALFTLAAERIDTRQLPAARFWQQVAERHLTALCQLPGDGGEVRVEAPPETDCAAWIRTAYKIPRAERAGAGR